MWIQQERSPRHIPIRELQYDTHARSGSTVVYSSGTRINPGERISVTPEIGPRLATRVSNTIRTPVKTYSGQQLASEYSSDRREGSKSETGITIHTQRADHSTPRQIPYTGSVSIVPIEIVKAPTIYQGSVTTPRRSQTYIATHQTLIDRTPRSPQGGSPAPVYSPSQQPQRSPLHHPAAAPIIQPLTTDQLRLTTSRLINPNEAAIRSARDTNTKLKQQLQQVRVDRDRVMQSNETLMQKLQVLSEKLHLKVLKRIQDRTQQATYQSPATQQSVPQTTSARMQSAATQLNSASRGYISLMGNKSHSRAATTHLLQGQPR